MSVPYDARVAPAAPPVAAPTRRYSRVIWHWYVSTGLFVVLLAACGAPAATESSSSASTSAGVAQSSAAADGGSPAASVAAEPSAQPSAPATASDDALGSPAAEQYGPSIAADLPPVAPDLASFPVTVENCGRTLTFEQPPERVVSLWQPTNELLLALGVADRIVALAGNYTALPSDLAAEAEGIKELGTSMAWPSREVVLSEQPDLVLSEGLEGFAFDASQGRPTVAELEAAGAQVISTGDSCTPADSATRRRSTQTVYDDLAMLGQVFGVSARADALIDTLKAKEAAVVATVAGREPVTVAFYNGGEGPLFVLSAGIWADLMRKAGVRMCWPRRCRWAATR